MTKRKNKQEESSLSIDQIEDILKKEGSKTGWEGDTLIEWLNNYKFADFFIEVFKIWSRDNTPLDYKILGKKIPYLHRTTIYDYMDKLVKTKMAQGNVGNRGELKSIIPLYEEGTRLLKMRKYLRKAFACSSKHL